MAETDPARVPKGLAVRRRLALAWLSLVWERLWIRLWVAAAAVGLLLALALSDLLSQMPAGPHIVVEVLAAVGVVALAVKGLRTFTWPSRAEARARLETGSPVVHRPLTTVEDSLAAGADAAQRWLWSLHQARAKRDLARLRVRVPAPGVAAKDRFALRALVVLALFIAVIVGSGGIPDRLVRAVVPTFAHIGPAVAIKLWITPPAYTGRSPIYIELPAKDDRAVPRTLDIAAGSKALAVITGSDHTTALALDGSTTPFDHLADASERVEIALHPAKRLELRQGSTVLAGWDVNWIPDTPPTIAFAAPPSEGARWRLKVDYRASDDYGVQDAAAEMTRADDTSANPETVTVPLTVPPFAPKLVNQATAVDLASHPWAGLKVKLRLKATDQAGQNGFSDTVTATLPERAFTHPVARELAKWRKALFADARANAAPAQASLGQILEHPDAFGGDPLVHLAIAAAKFRLGEEPPPEAVKTVPDLLWHAAVRIEDGNLAVAEQRLMQAEQDLREAVEKGASREETNRLVDKLQQALADYQKAKADKEANAQENKFANANQSSTPDDVAAMMKQLKELSQMGAKEAEKQLLAQLQQRLDQMRDQDAPGSEAQEVKDAEKLLNDMQNLAKNQADQLNQNFEKARQEETKQAREQSQGHQGPPERHPGQKQDQADQSGQKGGEKAAANQEELRKQLADIMDRMKKMTGKESQDLGEAQEAMGQARDALRAQAWKLGVDGQSQALSKLEQGSQRAQEDLAEAMFERGLGGMMEEMAGAPQLHFGQGQRTGHANGEDVNLPTGPDTEGMAGRVRAILEEIRSRAADRTRPEDEQDYLRRLMRQF